MHRFALVLTFLAACVASKPASSTSTPAPEPTYSEPTPEPTYEEPPPTEPASSVDPGCYEECMAYMDDDAGCTADCTSTGDYGSYDSCMDECTMAGYSEEECDADCY